MKIVPRLLGFVRMLGHMPAQIGGPGAIPSPPRARLTRRQRALRATIRLMNGKWLTERLDELLGRLGAGPQLASLQFYVGAADERGRRAARAYIVTSEALFEFDFSPGEYEPQLDIATGKRLEAWRMHARRIAWDEAPHLRAEADDAHRGSGRSISTGFVLGDVGLPSATPDQEAQTIAFAHAYWKHRIAARTGEPTPTSAPTGE